MAAAKGPGIEKRYGKPLKTILIEHYNIQGSEKGVARALGVSQGLVSMWFKAYGISVLKQRRISLPPEVEMQDTRAS